MTRPDDSSHALWRGGATVKAKRVLGYTHRF